MAVMPATAGLSGLFGALGGGSGVGSLVSAVSGLFGGGGDGKLHGEAREQAARNMKIQDDAFYHGIQYRVEDAKAAGINPIYALGAPTYNFSPVPLGGDGGSGAAGVASDFGQNIGRAISAMSTADERATAKVMAAQGIDKNAAEIDLLHAQAEQLRANANPAFPNGTRGQVIPGQGDASVTKFMQPGTGKKYFQVIQGPGGPHFMPSDDVSKIEGNDFTQIPQWYGNMGYGALKSIARDIADKLNRHRVSFYND